MRSRLYWIALVIGVASLLLATFALGFAVGGRMEAKQVVREVSPFLRGDIQVAVESDPYRGDYWLAALLGAVGVGALVTATRMKRRTAPKSISD